jgi:hypothetical protein
MQAKAVRVCSPLFSTTGEMPALKMMNLQKWDAPLAKNLIPLSFLLSGET